MAQRLKGKVAVVTGGGGGIGRGIAIDLASEGAKIVVNDLGVWTADKQVAEQFADPVVQEIKQSGGEAVANSDDVATTAGGEKIIKTAIDTFGRIDIVVCCAGNYKPNVIDETTEEEWDSIMSVHVNGHFNCIKPAASHMKQQKSGRIITFSSLGAFGLGKSPAYSTAKAGILGLSSSLARELGEYGITVNCIFPSAMTRLFPTDRVALYGIPPAKPAGSEMVAPMIAYLCTDEAGDINGEFFYVGGKDIGLYPQERRAMQLLHKAEGKWTMDELVELVPQTFGVNLHEPYKP